MRYFKKAKSKKMSDQIRKPDKPSSDEQKHPSNYVQIIEIKKFRRLGRQSFLQGSSLYRNFDLDMFFLAQICQNVFINDSEKITKFSKISFKIDEIGQNCPSPINMITWAINMMEFYLYEHDNSPLWKW